MKASELPDAIKEALSSAHTKYCEVLASPIEDGNERGVAIEAHRTGLASGALIGHEGGLKYASDVYVEVLTELRANYESHVGFAIKRLESLNRAFAGCGCQEICHCLEPGIEDYVEVAKELIAHLKRPMLPMRSSK